MAKMPKTANDWSLYSDASSRVRVAKALTSALGRAAQAVRKGSTAQNALYEILVPVADGFPNTGARDTETREIGYRYLRGIELAQRKTAGKTKPKRKRRKSGHKATSKPSNLGAVVADINRLTK